MSWPILASPGCLERPIFDLVIEPDLKKGVDPLLLASLAKEKVSTDSFVSEGGAVGCAFVIPTLGVQKT